MATQASSREGTAAIRSATPMSIITNDLELRAASVVSLTCDQRGHGEIVLVTSRGETEKLPLSGVLAVGPAWWTAAGRETPAPSTTLPVLDLTDGQRFIGILTDAEPVDPKAEPPVRIKSNRLGVLAAPLEHVARYVADSTRLPAGLPAKPGASDTVILATGDRVEGLVEALAPATRIALEPTGSAKQPAPEPITAPQILGAVLANPAAPARGPRIWLGDGAILRVDALELAQSSFTFARENVSNDLLAGELIGFAPDASRLTALATLTVASSTVDPSRLFGDPVHAGDGAARATPLSAGDVMLPGPMTAEWALPAGATGVLGRVELADDSLAWGDCRVTVELVTASGGSPKQLAGARLTGDAPSLDVRAPFDAAGPGARLRVQVSPGEQGSIQDRVVLRRMLLVTSAPAPAKP